MNNNRKIKFDFTDDGTLDKLRTQYDTFASKLVQNAKNFAFNQGGNQTTQQLKYIKDEIEYYKQSYDYQKKIFEEKKKQYDLNQKNKDGATQAFNNGRLSPENYKARINQLDKDNRGLLSGTGRRKWDGYEKDQISQLSSTQGYSTRLEKLIEGTNITLRQILSQEKTDALKTIEAIENDENASLEDKLAAGQAKTALSKYSVPKDKDERSVLKDLFTYGNLNSLLKNATGTLTAGSGLEATKNLLQASKEAAIGLSDILAGVAEKYLGKKGGKAAGGLIRIGSRIAGAGFDVAQDDLFSSYETRQQLDRVNFGNRALTGRNLQNFTLSDAGYSALDFAGANTNIARSMGTSRGSEGQTNNALLLEKGFGVNQEISANLLELSRTNKETDRNLISIVGGIYNSGQNIFKGDRTFLGEFINKNFASIQRELLKNRGSVASGTVMDVLNRFQSVGGQFDARNPNSIGLISSINSSLTNPNGDAMDALTFSALRKAMPGASIGDILREREKGLGSSKYLGATMGQLSQMGGSDDYQMINLSKAFGINYNASTELMKAYKKNPDLFNNMSQKQLKGYINNLGGMAGDNTNLSDKQTSELTDAKIQGNFAKMEEVVEQIGEIIKSSFSGATYTIDPATKQLTIRTPPRTNVTKKPMNHSTSATRSTLENTEVFLDNIFGSHLFKDHPSN